MKINPSPALSTVCMTLLTLSTTPSAPADQVSPQTTPDKHYTGNVVAVDSQEHILNVRGWLFGKQFNLGDRCAYVLPGQAVGSLNDLRPGEKIQVTYQKEQGVLVADRIDQVPMSYEGMVKSIDPVNRTLTVHVHALDRDFQIASACRIVLRNNLPGAITDIQPGDHVTVTYEVPGDQPTARQIAQTSQTFTGSLIALDLGERTVKAHGGLNTKKFSLADGCAILINGKLDGRLDELKPNERLEFTYDEVNGVNIVNRIAPATEPPVNSVMTSHPGTGY